MLKQTVLLFLLAALTTALAELRGQRGLIVGSFDDTVAPATSLCGNGGEVSQARAALQSSFPCSGLLTTSALTPEFLGQIDVLVLTSSIGAVTPITRSLTTAEQAALAAFVVGGGGVLMMVDNDSFHPNAAQVHASMLAPFGLAVTGTTDRIYAQVPAPLSHPVTHGPFGTLAATPNGSFFLLVPGHFSQLGSATALAHLSGNPTRTCLAVLSPGDAIPAGTIQGRVVLLSESGVHLDRDPHFPVNIFQQPDNRAVFLNSIAWLASAPCTGGSTRGGPGLAGFGGRAPDLCIAGCPTPRGAIAYVVQNGLPGGIGVLAAGLTPVQMPLFGGTLYTLPDVWALHQLSASGRITLPAPIPTSLGNLTVHCQGAYLDPGAVQGFSLTNEVVVSIR